MKKVFHQKKLPEYDQIRDQQSIFITLESMAKDISFRMRISWLMVSNAREQSMKIQRFQQTRYVM